MPLIAKGGQQTVRQQLGSQPVNPRPEYASGTVHFDSVAEDGTVVHHHQTFDRGELVEWARDDEPGPWALVRNGDPFDPFAPGLAGPDDVAEVSIRVGDEQFALPPADDIAEPGWDALPMVPNATSRLRFELTGSPVGPLALDIRYVDGKRAVCQIVDDWAETASGDDAHGAPEMHIIQSWRNYLRMRSGEVTALEAIEEGGHIDARWTLLLMLHGLLQEPTYVEVYRSLPEFPSELGWWGEVAPFIGDRDTFD